MQVFSAKGEFLKKWVSFGRADGQFQFPHGIAVDTNGNMYVADSGNNQGAGSSRSSCPKVDLAG